MLLHSYPASNSLDELVLHSLKHVSLPNLDYKVILHFNEGQFCWEPVCQFYFMFGDTSKLIHFLKDASLEVNFFVAV